MKYHKNNITANLASFLQYLHIVGFNFETYRTFVKSFEDFLCFTFCSTLIIHSRTKSFTSSSLASSEVFILEVVWLKTVFHPFVMCKWGLSGNDPLVAGERQTSSDQCSTFRSLHAPGSVCCDLEPSVIRKSLRWLILNL